MPSRFYFRPVSRGLGDLGGRLGAGVVGGVENFERGRSRRRAERRQDYEDERRHRFEDSAEARAMAAEGRIAELHPLDMESRRLGLEGDRTNLALTGRSIRGGMYEKGMELPEGTQRYGAIYGETPDATRRREFGEMEPALSLLSRGLGRDITPAMAHGAATLGIDPLTLADPRGDVEHGRRMDILEEEIRAARERQTQTETAAMNRARFQEGAQDRRQRERMVGNVIIDAFGEFDAEGNWTGGYTVAPEEVDAAARRYLETGEAPSPRERAPVVEIPGGRLQQQHVDEVVTFLFEDMAGKSRNQMVRELKRQKFTEEEIDYILDAFYDKLPPIGGRKPAGM